MGGWPPAVSEDGGWALADAAAAHAIDQIDAVRQPGEPAILVGLPSFKSDDAMRFPLERRGLDLQPAVTPPAPGDPAPGPMPAGVVTVVCDPLFDEVTGAACGGPAEDLWLADAYPPGEMALVERFRARPAPGHLDLRPVAAGVHRPAGGRRPLRRTPERGRARTRERRPLEAGVRCPRDPDVSVAGSRPVLCQGRPGVRAGGLDIGRGAP